MQQNQKAVAVNRGDGGRERNGVRLVLRRKKAKRNQIKKRAMNEKQGTEIGSGQSLS